MALSPDLRHNVFSIKWGFCADVGSSGTSGAVAGILHLVPWLFLDQGKRGSLTHPLPVSSNLHSQDRLWGDFHRVARCRSSL